MKWHIRISILGRYVCQTIRRSSKTVNYNFSALAPVIVSILVPSELSDATHIETIVESGLVWTHTWA
jgi:hypothetical protein